MMSASTGRALDQGEADNTRAPGKFADNCPLVSVGLPVFNGEAFIEEAINAILEQDYRNLDVIVSDNGSTDGTRRILEAVARDDDRIRIFLHQENRGATWNFNFVFSQARGPLFKWATHDDVCAPSFISACVRALESAPDAVLAYPGAYIIDSAGEVVREVPRVGFAGQRERVARASAMLRRPSGCFENCGVIRREALAASRLLGGYASADRVMCFELGLIGRFVEVEERLFYYRSHAGQSVSRFPAPRERSRWFDRDGRKGSVFPHWRVFGEYVAAVRLHVPARERPRAYLALLGWLGRHGQQLARDGVSGAWRKVQGNG